MCPKPEASDEVVASSAPRPLRDVHASHLARATKSLKLGFFSVLSPDVAKAVAKAIREVVSDGTAKRAKTAFVGADGVPIPMGGKTGTGDQRFDVYGAGGRLIESRTHKTTAADHQHPTFSADSTRIEIQSAMLSENGRSLNICVIPVPKTWLARHYIDKAPE